MINLEQIKDAHKNITPYINYTPLLHSNYLSKNSNVYLKLESLQITGSFKLRGAINKLLSLNNDEKKKKFFNYKKNTTIPVPDKIRDRCRDL